MDDRKADRTAAYGILSLVDPLLDKPLHGAIHSVFEHACNIMFGKRMMTVVQGDERIPDSIRLSAEAFAQLVSAGKASQIRLCETELSWNDASIPLHIDDWDGSMLAGAFDAVGILQAIRKAGIPKLALSAAAQDDLHTAAEAILLNQWTKSHRILQRLIGLGQGLTPSADDAVVGILATLRRSDGIRFPIPVELLERTTDVSAKYLRCAGQGYFSQRVLAIFEADTAGLPQALERTAAWGASSGSDMLHGVRMVCEIKCRQEG